MSLWLLAKFPVFIVLAIWFVWGYYLAMMSLKRAHEAGKLSTVAKILGYPHLAMFLVFDCAFNIIVGTVMFAQIPRQLLFTARLDDELLGDPSGWRHKLAMWFCINLLDSFDPDGHHCG